MRILRIVIMVMTTCHFLHGDYFTEYIKYEAQPDFSRIVITNETIRGQQGVDHFKENSKEYQGKNMFLTRYYNGDSKRIEKVESMVGHEIKSVLTIHPPSGHGSVEPSPQISCRFISMRNWHSILLLAIVISLKSLSPKL